MKIKFDEEAMYDLLGEAWTNRKKKEPLKEKQHIFSLEELAPKDFDSLLKYMNSTGVKVVRYQDNVLDIQGGTQEARKCVRKLLVDDIWVKACLNLYLQGVLVGYEGENTTVNENYYKEGDKRPPSPVICKGGKIIL